MLYFYSQFVGTPTFLDLSLITFRDYLLSVKRIQKRGWIVLFVFGAPVSSGPGPPHSRGF